MNISIGIDHRENNDQLLSRMVVQVDIDSDEYIAIDVDFIERMQEAIKNVLDNEIEGTKELD